MTLAYQPFTDYRAWAKAAVDAGYEIEQVSGLPDLEHGPCEADMYPTFTASLDGKLHGWFSFEPEQFHDHDGRLYADSQLATQTWHEGDQA